MATRKWTEWTTLTYEDLRKEVKREGNLTRGENIIFAGMQEQPGLIGGKTDGQRGQRFSLDDLLKSGVLRGFYNHSQRIPTIIGKVRGPIAHHPYYEYTGLAVPSTLLGFQSTYMPSANFTLMNFSYYISPQTASGTIYSPAIQDNPPSLRNTGEFIEIFFEQDSPPTHICWYTMRFYYTESDPFREDWLEWRSMS